MDSLSRFSARAQRRSTPRHPGAGSPGFRLINHPLPLALRIAGESSDRCAASSMLPVAGTGTLRCVFSRGASQDVWRRIKFSLLAVPWIGCPPRNVIRRRSAAVRECPSTAEPLKDPAVGRWYLLLPSRRSPITQFDCYHALVASDSGTDSDIASLDFDSDSDIAASRACPDPGGPRGDCAMCSVAAAAAEPSNAEPASGADYFAAVRPGLKKAGKARSLPLRL